MLKVIEDHNGNKVYQGLTFDISEEDLKKLDREIVLSTLAGMEFYANMSDSYERTLSELESIINFRKKHGLTK